jgi:PAS domain S-box-containing protein
MEGELMESQNQWLMALINNSEEAIIFSVDRNYCYTVFNEKHRQEMKKVWQVDIQLGMSLLEVMANQALREATKKSIDRALNGETFVEIQHQPQLNSVLEVKWSPVCLNGDQVAGAMAFMRDTPYQTRTKNKLEISEDRYRLAQQAAHIGSWEWDILADALFWSEEMYRLFDNPPALFTPTYAAFIESIFPEDRPKTAKAIEEAIAHDLPLDVEYRIFDSAGQIKWLNLKGKALYSANGRPILALGTMQDINERKQVELSLQQRLVELETVYQLSMHFRAGETVQELLQILLDKTLKAIRAEDGSIFLLEPASDKLELCVAKGWFEQLAGLKLQRDEGINGHVFTTQKPYITSETQSDQYLAQRVKSLIPPNQCGGFFPIHCSEGIVGVLDVYVPLPRTFTENEIRLFTIISQLAGNAILRSRLHEKLKLSNSVLLEEVERSTAYQGMLADEKELLSTTLMSIGEGVIITDKEGYIVLYNRAAEDITGYTTEEVVEKPLAQVFQIIDPITQQVTQDTVQTLYTMSQIQENKINYKAPALITKCGERILVSGSISRIKSPDGEMRGHVIVFQNITEKQKAEAQTALSQKMEAIGQLAAGIAHEINTPIQYIGDNLRFLQKAFAKVFEILEVYHDLLLDPDRPVTQADLERIEEIKSQKKIQTYLHESPEAIQEALNGVERVRKIVLAMREFSHPSEKEKKFADINHGIETTIIISRNEWKYCAELETDLDPELPLVNCQIDEINQVILNMIVNSAQSIQEKLPADSEQKGKIIISTRQGENKVLITIQDTGKGIPKTIVARIFDPFFTTKGVGKGTGQGLSMAHNIIVNKHQGKIKVDSVEGEGAIFTIELPIHGQKQES